ncbi:MAG: hypothetical protein ACYC1D_17860 [Acidimicrobiales bacterium]
MVRLEHHPHFASQYVQLCRITGKTEIAGEVTQLLDALEQFGHGIEGEDPGDASHPIVISTLDMFALRRTPHTGYTPYADNPPVLRIPYVWFRDAETKSELAVVMLIGDKTTLGNQWYPPRVQLIESKLVPEWERANPTHRAWRRRH